MSANHRRTVCPHVSAASSVDLPRVGFLRSPRVTACAAWPCETRYRLHPVLSADPNFPPATTPQYWGTGVASSLLAQGVGWILERGWETARLRVVEAQARARRFYEREGWRPDADVEPAHNGFFKLVYYRRALAL